MVKNYIVAEYSVTQKAFHVHDIKSMLDKNIMNMAREGKSDYLPIGVFESELDAKQYIEQVKKALKDKPNDWVDDLLKDILK